MKLYVYALTDSPPDLTDLSGLQHERLETAALDRAFAIIGRVADGVPPTRKTLEAQDRLVRAMHERSQSLLPARFGTLVTDENALRRHPALQADVLGPALERVRGREQMTLRIVTDRPAAASVTNEPSIDPTSESAGRRYLEQRRAREALPEEARAVTRAVAAITRGERSQRGSVPGVLATVYHLIDRGRGDDYRAKVAKANTLRPGVTVIVNGPAPAYAFGPEDR
jgi:hypothetical protein